MSEEASTTEPRFDGYDLEERTAAFGEAIIGFAMSELHLIISRIRRTTLDRS